MARKQGGVNKFLNFIGLVDDEPQRAADDYADNYGRPSTYVPKQQRSRTEDTRRRTIVKDERGRYGADRYASTRVTPPASRRTSSVGYDYNYVPRDTRSSYEPASTRAQTRAQRQRTLMCSLNTLEDCCDVIDSLIAGNVVVLTRNKGYRKKTKEMHIPTFIYKGYPRLREALARRCACYNDQLAMVERMEAEGRIVVIRPQRPVDVGRMERNIVKLRALYGEGYACARKVISALLA